MLAKGDFDLHPTVFETVTAMAFLLFQQAAVQTVVLEVRLGGHLDATNVVTPVQSVITPVDFDHQEFLGDTLGQIAGEKAGILKRVIPAVFSRRQPEAERILENRAREIGAVFSRTRDWPIEKLEMSSRGSRFRTGGHVIECPFPGEHQVENALTAALALPQLGYPTAGIAQARWPGRLERIGARPEFILDGAHNPAGVRALGNHIHRFYADRRIWLIFGIMRDKPVEEMTRLLFPLAHRIIVTAPDNVRSMAPEDIRSLYPQAEPIEIAPRVRDALAVVKQAAPQDVVIVTGSLFLVGEARAFLQDRPLSEGMQSTT